MSRDPDLLDQSSHFAFGRNWASYAELIGSSEVSQAQDGMRRLVGDSLAGKRVLDIGCGSGLHSLAALELGAAEVLAVDIDPDSVATTRRVLTARAAGRWEVRQSTVFELDPARTGRFDVVYSWGVLHHTGDMYRAIRCAAALVVPGGLLALALYRRTMLCGFWKAEKRWYAKASPRAQARARSVYVGLYRVLHAVRGRSFEKFVAEYPRQNRGMDFHHDVHDWMGGWPYESVSAGEAARFMDELGFDRVRSFARDGFDPGVFGSGCDEYVFVRRTVSASLRGIGA